MTYVSRPVRHVRENPVPGETVTLLLRLESDSDPDEIAARVRDLAATVESDLPFDTLAATVDHERVDDICELSGLEAVETENTLDIGAGDAGEDVEF